MSARIVALARFPGSPVRTAPILPNENLRTAPLVAVAFLGALALRLRAKLGFAE